MSDGEWVAADVFCRSRDEAKKKKKVYVAMLFFLADLTTLGTIPNTEYCHVNQPEPVPGDTSGEVG